MSANEDIADAVTARRMRLLDFEAGAVAATLEVYDRATEALAAELERIAKRVEAGGTISVEEARRLRARVAALDAQIRDARAELQAELRANLNTVATVEAAQTAAVVGSATADLGVAWVALPPPRAIATVGAAWATTLDVGLAATRATVRTEMASAFARGLGVDASVREIMRATGALRGERERLVTLVRTEFQRTANAVAMESYVANQDVLAGVQYLATLDSRTCPLCGPYHNRVFPINATGPVGAPYLPRHPRCRCFYVPVTKSWEELGVQGLSFRQRQQLDGAPSEATTFDGWLRRRPEAEQRDVLDADWRYEAWQAGATIASFSRDNRLLSREEYAAA